jgi:hypothetical protein
MGGKWTVGGGRWKVEGGKGREKPLYMQPFVHEIAISIFI